MTVPPCNEDRRTEKKGQDKPDGQIDQVKHIVDPEEILQTDRTVQKAPSGESFFILRYPN